MDIFYEISKTVEELSDTVGDLMDKLDTASSEDCLWELAEPRLRSECQDHYKEVRRLYRMLDEVSELSETMIELYEN